LFTLLAQAAKALISGGPQPLALITELLDLSQALIKHGFEFNSFRLTDTQFDCFIHDSISSHRQHYLIAIGLQVQGEVFSILDSPSSIFDLLCYTEAMSETLTYPPEAYGQLFLTLYEQLNGPESMEPMLEQKGRSYQARI
jgi:hypothetical protein